MSNLADILLKVPKKDKGSNMPRFINNTPNNTHQADLLFLPHDSTELELKDSKVRARANKNIEEATRTYKYVLVVVDIATRLTDATPLKNKTSSDVLAGFKKIYRQSILELPSNIDVDSGTEFQGVVLKYFNDNGVSVHVANPHRHRQLGMVERRNQIIGKHLFRRMLEEEILTKQPAKQWVTDLPKIITEMNDKARRRKPRPPTDNYIVGDGELLTQGTRVRVQLDEPVDYITRKRLPGKFRSTDIRWNPDPRVIMRTLLQRGQPALYLLDEKDGEGIDRTASYTKNQLQIIKKNEKMPDSNVIRPVIVDGKEQYVVESLGAKKKIKNKVHYLVKWKGFDSKDNTWEPRAQLVKDVPEIVKEREKK